MMEKSCGAIVYKKENDEYKYLIAHQSNGHFSFPKGHMEENETEEQTAIREIKEETNIDVELDTNFRKSISYFIESKGVNKEAVYFVATPTSFNLINQEGEIDECCWEDYETTKEKIEYADIIEVFEEAVKYIKSK